MKHTPLASFLAYEAERQLCLKIRNSLSADQAEIARRKAQAPLKPRAPQLACDVGLWDDKRTQIDIMDLMNAKQ